MLHNLLDNQLQVTINHNNLSKYIGKALPIQHPIKLWKLWVIRKIVPPNSINAVTDRWKKSAYSLHYLIIYLFD
jgi:hypothetical protein